MVDYEEEEKHYVIHNGKHLFCPRSHSVDRIIELYGTVMRELYRYLIFVYHKMQFSQSHQIEVRFSLDGKIRL